MGEEKMADMANAPKVGDEGWSGANDDREPGNAPLRLWSFRLRKSKKRACAEKSFQKLPVEENATRASVPQRSSGLLTSSEKWARQAEWQARDGWA